jgi:hypothetical protein
MVASENLLLNKGEFQMEKFVRIIGGKVSIVELDITKSDLEELFNALLVNNHIFNVESDSDVELLKDLCFSTASHVYQAISGNPRLSKMLSVSGVVAAMQNQEVDGYNDVFPLKELIAEIRQNLPWEEFKELVDKA